MRHSCDVSSDGAFRRRWRRWERPRRERAVTCGIVVRCAPCDMAMEPMRADVPRACGRAVDSTRVRGRSDAGGVLSREKVDLRFLGRAEPEPLFVARLRFVKGHGPGRRGHARDRRGRRGFAPEAPRRSTVEDTVPAVQPLEAPAGVDVQRDRVRLRVLEAPAGHQEEAPVRPDHGQGRAVGRLRPTTTHTPGATHVSTTRANRGTPSRLRPERTRN